MIDFAPTTVLIDGVEIAWNQEPASVEVAREDLLRLTQDVEDITTQLEVANLEGRGDPVWRKRALWARRSKGRRVAFLADWLRGHDPERSLPPWSDEASGPGTMQRLAHRLGVLEAVLAAAERCVAEDTDDAHEALVEWVARARAVSGLVA